MSRSGELTRAGCMIRVIMHDICTGRGLGSTGGGCSPFRRDPLLAGPDRNPAGEFPRWPCRVRCTALTAVVWLAVTEVFDISARVAATGSGATIVPGP